MKFAIVTGTSSGIGACLAEQLLAGGWQVLGISRRAAACAGTCYQHFSIDLSAIEACWAPLETIIKGRLGERPWERIGLVNNAATLASGPLTKLDAAALARALTLNVAVPSALMGLCTAATAAPLRIINLSSGAATRAYSGWGAYCVSKAALSMAGQVLAQELQEIAGLAGRDIAVVDYAPGVVDTPMQLAARSADPQDFPQVQRFIDLHEHGELVDPARPAAEICQLLESDALARFSTRRFGS